jgi:hypothetical protein
MSVPDKPARVLILRGHPERARRILERIYPSATPSQLARKVDEMVESVQVDTALGGASVQEKLNRLFYVGSNRRALGQSIPTLLLVTRADEQS